MDTGVAQVPWTPRGTRLGRRLPQALEEQARTRGTRATRLETSRHVSETVAMYQSVGYRDVPAFSAEPYAHHWFEKGQVGVTPVTGRS